MDSIVARKMHRTLEPYHGMIYFSPEAALEYAELASGHDRQGYFASRAAPVGAVTADVVTATFFNFNPGLVSDAMAGAWEVAEPSTWIGARRRGVDATLRKHLGDAVEGSEMGRAAELARIAAEGCGSPGRPLTAGLLSLDWPEPPHLALWHAVSVTREFRGDGHVAVLVVDGVAPVEALVLHGGTGEVPSEALRATRGWPRAAWDRARSDLGARGLLGEDGPLTESGQAFREDIEARSDLAAMAPWEALGQEGCDELRRLVRPYSRALVAGGAFDL